MSAKFARASVGTICRLIFHLAAAISSFAAGKQLTGAYTPAPSLPLAPGEAEKQFHVPPGFEVRLFAAEPDIINPVAMTWDAHGRLWVVELYEYPLGAPAGAKPRDRIKILEDTDNDGRADKVTVFADGLNLATGILLGNGGVYVGQAPDLLFLRDTNHDDVADSRTVLLTGFGLDDRHELLNGFAWGPDGWLYLTHGVFTHSKVRIPEASAPGVEVTAAVARFQPVTRRFEVFADGTSNPWGVDFDRNGNAFVSACVIDHLFHMAPGGIYVRQGGFPANPYAYELLPSIVDHKHHMAAYSGICIYQGDQFPADYRGGAFMGNIHQNAINHDRLTPNGSSFKAAAEKDFVTTTDGWFRPVSEQVGPDGALWVADWYDKYPCYQNAQADPEGVDREHGRIWRVVYTGQHPGAKVPSRPRLDMDLEGLNNDELVSLLANQNIWQRRMAQRLLSERSDRAPAMQDNYGLTSNSGLGGAIHERLENLVLHGKDGETRLAALWTLHGLGSVWQMNPSQNRLESWPDFLLRFFNSDDPAVRSWAVTFAAEEMRFLGRQIPALEKSYNDEHLKNARALRDAILASFEKLAADSHPIVRLAVATAVRRLVSSSLTVDADLNTDIPIGKILSALGKASADATDPLLPFMIWMAGEPALAANPQGGLKWLAEKGVDAMPLSGILARKAMRRICDTEDTAKLNSAVAFLSAVAQKNDAITAAAIDGLIEGQRAKPLVPGVDTKPLFDLLAAKPQLKERAQQLGALWGNAASIHETFLAINDANLSVEQRSRAIDAATRLKNDAARQALLKLIDGNNPEPLVTRAIRGLGEIGGDAVSDDLLRVWRSLPAVSRAAAADVLVSRRRWAIALLSAVESKTIAPIELPISALRSLAESKDDFIRQRAAQAIGRIRPAGADKRKIIETKKAMILSGGAPDLKVGRELARKTCLICHKLYGEGAEVGPDLTGVGRSSLDALLANVIDPNQVVGKGYENVEVETKDGRSVSGRLVENSETRVRLLSPGPKEEILARSDIASLRVSELSVMPEGLEQMPDNDFRNLILYVLNPSEAPK